MLRLWMMMFGYRLQNSRSVDEGLDSWDAVAVDGHGSRRENAQPRRVELGECIVVAGEMTPLGGVENAIVGGLLVRDRGVVE